MMDERASITSIRQSFDDSFAELPISGSRDGEDFLAIRVGGEALVLRVRELAGFQVGRKVIPLESKATGFLGVAGMRGGLLPVFSLSVLLGHPLEPSGRWLVLCGGAQPLGLSVRDFDGYLRGTADSLLPAAGAVPAGRHARELLRVDQLLRPVVSIPSLVSHIRNGAASAAQEAS